MKHISVSLWFIGALAISALFGPGCIASSDEVDPDEEATEEMAEAEENVSEASAAACSCGTCGSAPTCSCNYNCSSGNLPCLKQKQQCQLNCQSALASYLNCETFRQSCLVACSGTPLPDLR